MRRARETSNKREAGGEAQRAALQREAAQADKMDSFQRASFPAAKCRGRAFFALPLEAGSEYGYLKACSGTDPVSSPARLSTSNTEQNPTN